MNRNCPFDPQPVLAGPSITLRPLHPEDLEPLFAVASDPLIWVLHPEPTRYQRPVFEGYFASGLASGGALVVEEIATGNLVGSSRYYDWDPGAREVAIGYTFLARSHWGGLVNREMKRLMLDHAFRWAETVWFHVGKENWRSRKAMEKIGGQFSHEARKELFGKTHDYVFYKIQRLSWQDLRGRDF
jgi:RimJ/RimL family protein N-acetyltransferase